jgi:hypothetical protein
MAFISTNPALATRGSAEVLCKQNAAEFKRSIPQTQVTRADLIGPCQAPVTGAPTTAQSHARAAPWDAVIAKNESAEGYGRLVARIDANTRVVECAAGIQWVLQRRGDRGEAWRGVSFCRTKQALLRCVREWASSEHPEMEALPDRFPERAKDALSWGARP